MAFCVGGHGERTNRQVVEALSRGKGLQPSYAVERNVERFVERFYFSISGPEAGDGGPSLSHWS